MDWWIVVLAVLIFSVAIGTISYSIVVERKRTEAMVKLAKDLEFEFSPVGFGELDSLRGTFQLFQRGKNRRCYNAMRGEAMGLELNLFDYEFVSGSGKHKHTIKQTVLAMRFQPPSLPHFELRPEGLWDKMMGIIGFGKQVALPNFPTFDAKYHLSGPDPDQIRFVFNAQAIAAIETMRPLSIEGKGGMLAIYRPRERVAPEKIKELMQEGFEVQQLLRGATASESP